MQCEKQYKRRGEARPVIYTHAIYSSPLAASSIESERHLLGEGERERALSRPANRENPERERERERESCRRNSGGGSWRCTHWIRQLNNISNISDITIGEVLFLPSTIPPSMAVSRKQAEKDAKIQKFEAFVEQKLKPDLVHVMSERDKVMEQKKIISDLSKNIKLMEQNRLKKLRMMVNLGSEVYAQAEVPDTSRIFVDIGLGFHVEFTWSEALQFISVKEEVLARQVEEHTRQIANIKAQIKLVGEGIRELLNLSEASARLGK